MDLKTKQAFIRQMASVYRKATKKEKGKILDQVVIATGYHRFRASWLLTHPPVSLKEKLKRMRKSKYDVVVSPLKKIYGISNFASGKRLVGMIPSYVETLVRDRELFLTEKQQELLLSVSAATIERLIWLPIVELLSKESLPIPLILLILILIGMNALLF